MFDLVEHGRAGDDPSFCLKEYAAPEGCATSDRGARRIPNSALADPEPFLAEDGLEAVRRTTREAVFRQLRLGQWHAGSDAWLPWGGWAGCTDPVRVVADRDRIVLAFAGSAPSDSTALECTVGPSRI